jgi:hypothetical protein
MFALPAANSFDGNRRRLMNQLNGYAHVAITSVGKVNRRTCGRVEMMNDLISKR